MAQAQVIQGTWEEIANHARTLQGRKNLTLIVPSEESEVTPIAHEHFYLTATPEEFRRAFDALGAGNENLPLLPPEAFDRESLYDEDRS
jgi:hypothetical protein